MKYQKSISNGQLKSKLKIQQEIQKMKCEIIANKSLVSNICEEITNSKISEAQISSQSKPAKIKEPFLSDNLSDLTDPKTQKNELISQNDFPPFDVKFPNEQGVLTQKNMKILLAALKQKFKKLNQFVLTLQQKNSVLESQDSIAQKELQLQKIQVQKFDAKLKSTETENLELKNKIRYLESKAQDYQQQNQSLNSFP